MGQLTVAQLFYDSYRDAGVPGIMEQSGLDPDRTEEARTQFNRMVDALQLDGGTISHVARLLFQITPNQSDYTVGPGGDWDPGQGISWSGLPGQIPSNYPVRIQRASMVLTTQNYAGAGPPEYPLFPLSLDEWQSWTLKMQTTNFPRRYFYEPAYASSNGLAIFHLLYVPYDDDMVALYLEETLQQIATAGDAVLDFRPGYQDMLTCGLAMRIADRTPDAQIKPGVVERYEYSLEMIRQNNNRPLSRANDMTSSSRWRSNVFLGNRYQQ
jgi:hypothetical protein